MKLTPQIMFQGEMTAALDLWRGAFPDMTVTPLMQDGDRTVLAEVTIAGQRLTCFDSPPLHDFTFTPAISLVVTCDTEAEVDRLFARLSEGGKVLMGLASYPFSPRYGWTSDRFGLSWQIMLAA